MNKLSLNAKIILGFALAASVAFAVGASGLSAASKLSEMLGAMYDNNLVAIADVGEANAQALTHSRLLVRYIIEPKQEEKDKVNTTMKGNVVEMNRLLEKYRKTVLVPEEVALIARFEKAWPAYEAAAIKVQAYAYYDDTNNAMSTFREVALPAFVEVDNILSEIIKVNVEFAKQADASGDVLYAHVRTQLLIIMFVGFFAAVGAGFVISRNISNKINAIVTSLSESSGQITSASAEVASLSEELSQAATEQAASLEETAASLEEISTMIAKSSESAGATQESSNESKDKAAEGQKAVEHMMTSMNEISESNDAIMKQVNSSNQKMSEIVAVILEIGNKTKVINEIVFQTKLLSFNASVEAARAGEHGKGFAVVAEEVGNLAQMSGNAAKDITEMLDSSTSKVQAIVDETKSSVEGLVARGKQKVDSGVNVARECAQVLEEIMSNVSKVTTLSQEISTATKEQAQGVNEINKAMSQLDSVTQQNSATSEEAASAAEQLSAQAESLNAAVAELVTTIKGQGAKVHTVVSSAKAAKAAAPKKASNNVVKADFTKAKTASTKHVANKIPLASGDAGVPSRDDAGFEDI